MREIDFSRTVNILIFGNVGDWLWHIRIYQNGFDLDNLKITKQLLISIKSNFSMTSDKGWVKDMVNISWMVFSYFPRQFCEYFMDGTDFSLVTFYYSRGFCEYFMEMTRENVSPCTIQTCLLTFTKITFTQID